MKPAHPTIGLLICGALIGCAHADKKTGSFTMRVGSYTAGGITYFPATPGTTSYGVVDFTTNQPPAGAKDYVDVVTTNGNWKINVIDGK